MRAIPAAAVLALLAGCGGPPSTDGPPRAVPEPARSRLEKIVREEAFSHQALHAKADRLYAEGLKHYEEWRYEEARKYFRRAVEVYSKHPKAREYLAKTRLILDVHKGRAADALEELSSSRSRARIQELLLEIGKGMKKAGEHYANAAASVSGGLTMELAPERFYAIAIEDLGKCIAQCDRVIEIIKWMPSPPDLSSARDKMTALRAKAVKDLAKHEAALAALRRAEALKKARSDEKRHAEFRAERLAKLVEQAQRFYDKEQYRECEMMCIQILDLDPLNADAQALKLKARMKKHEQKEAETYSSKKGKPGEAAAVLPVEEAGTPAGGPGSPYPANWKQILRRSEGQGIGAGDEPAWRRAIRAKLERKVSFEFVDTPLPEAINFLQTLTHVNMIIDPRVGEKIIKTPIDLKVSDMNLRLALEWILKIAELDYVLKDNAVLISKPENLRGEVALKIYDVRDITKAASEKWCSILLLGAHDDSEERDNEPKTSLAEMIQSRIMPKSWAAELGTSIEERGGSLVVMQRPRVHKLIGEMLASIRESEDPGASGKKAEEAEKARDKFLEEIGVQFADVEDIGRTGPAPRAMQIIPSFVWNEIAVRAAEGDEDALEPAWRKDIRRALKRRVSFDFRETPLSEAVNALQTLSHVNMIIDPASVKAPGPTVTLKAADMELALALEWLCKRAGLAYDIRQEAVFISTPARVASEVKLRIYDVSDLTGALEHFPGSGPISDDEKKALERAIPDLPGMIRARVRPETWGEKHGTSIEERGGQLVVMQKPEVHKLIEKLLASFRERKKLLIEVEKRFLEKKEAPPPPAAPAAKSSP